MDEGPSGTPITPHRTADVVHRPNASDLSHAYPSLIDYRIWNREAHLTGGSLFLPASLFARSSRIDQC